MGMQVRQVSAATGRAWVFAGIALWRRSPLTLMIVTMTYVILLVVSSIIPVIGAFAPWLLAPVLSVGILHAVRAVANGGFASPAQLFLGFRDRHGHAWKPLLVLGLFNVMSVVLGLGVSAIVDQGTLFDLVMGKVELTDPKLLDAPLLLSMLAFLCVYTPIQMALWFSPVFCAWHGMTSGKAMFFSLAAVMRNKWAFTQYGLTWGAVAMACSVLITLVRMLVGNAPLLMSMLVSPLSLLLMTTFFCSFWPGYRDVIVDDDQSADNPGRQPVTPQLQDAQDS